MNFMSVGYDLIGEPLNLLDGGQAWFTSVLNDLNADVNGTALVLGATPWIARLAQQRFRRVDVVDSSAVMLSKVEARCDLSAKHRANEIRLINADWLAMPRLEDRISIVLGDNPLLFLRYPDQWTQLCNALAEAMIPGGCILIRTVCVPSTHSETSIPAIVARFTGPETVNCTEVRARLLFAHWDSVTGAIATEEVLNSFETNRELFQPLIDRVSLDNDLLTITKYRNSGAIYYAPRLEQALSAFRKEFAVRAVHFGPYPLSDYFPLIVAMKV